MPMFYFFDLQYINFWGHVKRYEELRQHVLLSCTFVRSTFILPVARMSRSLKNLEVYLSGLSHAMPPIFTIKVAKYLNGRYHIH